MGAGSRGGQPAAEPDAAGTHRAGGRVPEGRYGADGAGGDGLQQGQLRTGIEQQRVDLEAKAIAGRTFQELGQAAQKGEITDAATTSKVLQNVGYPEAQADAQAQALVGISKEKRAIIDAAEEAKTARERAAQEARSADADKRLAVILKGLQVKATDKSDMDKAIEETAASLAKGDLSSIRDISSFRAQERVKIYARAKELNPNFSVAETQRKIDMEKSFTVGKDGVGIQSFDTFLQHAGELSDVLKDLYQSGSPAFNKPMNWIRKNLAGDPKYQRLLVAIEPVGKEFESFLLNQRALYIDDRRQIETFLNGNSSPAQLASGLKQMGKTAERQIFRHESTLQACDEARPRSPILWRGYSQHPRLGLISGYQAARMEVHRRADYDQWLKKKEQEGKQ